MINLFNLNYTFDQNKYILFTFLLFTYLLINNIEINEI